MLLAHVHWSALQSASNGFEFALISFELNSSQYDFLDLFVAITIKNDFGTEYNSTSFLLNINRNPPMCGKLSIEMKTINSKQRQFLKFSMPIYYYKNTKRFLYLTKKCNIGVNFLPFGQ